MATFSSPSDVAAATLARSASVNNLDAATAAAFALLPTNANIDAGKVTYGTDTGAADAYVVAMPHTATSYADGLHVAFKPVYSCTGASTINVDGLGLKTIKLSSGAAVEAGHIIAGTPVEMRYSTTTGYFHLVGIPGAAGVAGSLSGTDIGTIELLTGASIAGGTTINLTTASGNRVHITGSGWNCTTVTLDKGPRTVIFDDVGTLTHHATTNNLPGAADITTAAGDRAIYESDGTTVYCIEYTRAISGDLAYTARTSDTVLSAADFTTDSRKFIDVTSGTFSQTTATASAIGANKWIRYRNSGSGIVTFTPGSGTIDGLASLEFWTGSVRDIFCDGTNFRTVPLVGGVMKSSTSGTWNKTSGVPAYDIRITGGGAGGGGGGGGGSGRGVNSNSGSGGSGGSGGAGGQSGQTVRRLTPAAQLAATVSYVIGTGGAGGTSGTGAVGATSGNPGNDGVDGGDGAAGVASTFGSSTNAYYLSASGGAAGTNKGLKGLAGSNNTAGGVAVTNNASLATSTVNVTMAISTVTINGGVSVAGTAQNSTGTGMAGGAGGTSSVAYGALTAEAGAAGGATNSGAVPSAGNAGTTPAAPSTPGMGGIGGGGGGGSPGVGAGASAATGAGGAGGVGGAGAAGQLEVIEIL
jgi:hypothetical protein